jgi:multidrug resistance efflux pump
VTDGTDPTPGEVWRKIEDVARQLTAIVDRLERRDTYIEENFVRQKVWLEARKADQAATANLQQDIGAIQKQQDADRSWRRQAGLAIALALVSSLLTIVGLVMTLTGR